MKGGLLGERIEKVRTKPLKDWAREKGKKAEGYADLRLSLSVYRCKQVTNRNQGWR
jgi:hypothetical protein